MMYIFRLYDVYISLIVWLFFLSDVYWHTISLQWKPLGSWSRIDHVTWWSCVFWLQFCV